MSKYRLISKRSIKGNCVEDKELDLDVYWHELKRLGTAHGENIWDKEAWCEPFYEGKTAADAFYEEFPEHKK
jgi:hypothetical protein